MKYVAKIISLATACPLLVSADPGNDDLTWAFRSNDIYNSPIFLFLVAMAASALVFRFAFRHK